MTTARQLADNFDYYKNNYFKFDGGTWRLFDKDDNFLYFDDYCVKGIIPVFIHNNDTKFVWTEPMTDVECYDDSDIDSDATDLVIGDSDKQEMENDLTDLLNNNINDNSKN